MRRQLNSREGFSLMELVLVIIILGIVFAMTAPIIGSGFKVLVAATDVTDMNSQGELAMQRMVRELRGINPDTDFDGSNLPGGTQVKFNQPSGASPPSWVTYSVQGGALQRNSDILASYVSSVNFSYVNSAGAGLTPPLTLAQAKSIWQIRIVLQLSERQVSETLRTSVFLRSGPKSR